MEAVQTRQDANPPSFETVWAALMEVAERQKESAEWQKETERQMKENAERQHKEWQREMKESAERLDRQIQETDRQMQKTDSQLGRLDKRMGEVVEYMDAPDLLEKFSGLGLNFSKSSHNTVVTDRDNKISFEIDVFLDNYSKAMLVKVKTKPTTEDVKEHVRRLEKMRRYADLHGDKRTFIGSVAGMVMTDNVKKHVLKKGFYVIEPSGEDFTITPPKGQPKEW